MSREESCKTEALAKLQEFRRRQPITKHDLADALDCFWNAALGATHPHQDGTANTVMAGIVEGSPMRWPCNRRSFTIH